MIKQILFAFTFLTFATAGICCDELEHIGKPKSQIENELGIIFEKHQLLDEAPKTVLLMVQPENTIVYSIKGNNPFHFYYAFDKNDNLQQVVRFFKLVDNNLSIKQLAMFHALKYKKCSELLSKNDRSDGTTQWIFKKDTNIVVLADDNDKRVIIITGDMQKTMINLFNIE